MMHGHKLFDIKNLKIYVPTICLAGVVSAFCLTLAACRMDPRAAIPQLFGIVTIDGYQNPVVGRRLTANTNLLGGDPRSPLTFQWRSGIENVENDEGNSDGFTVRPGDIGRVITVIVVREGYSGAAIGGPTHIVFCNNSDDSGLEELYGTVVVMGDGLAPLVGHPMVGDTLEADTRGLDGTGRYATFYQWMRRWHPHVDGEPWIPIPGANGRTYTLQAADQGHLISVRVVLANHSRFQDSAPVGPVQPRAQPPGPDPDPGTVTVTISIAGFTFTNHGYLGNIVYDGGSPSITSLPAPVYVTGAPPGATWSINGVNQGAITGGVILTPALVGIGENSITIYMTDGGRNFSMTFWVDVSL